MMSSLSGEGEGMEGRSDENNKNSNESDSSCISSCCSFRLEEIKSEVTTLRQVLELRSVLWEEECSVYDGSSSTNNSTTRVGRRNQSNFFNRLQDVNLFPYSNKLYSFVSAYDGGIIRDGIIHSGAMFHYDGTDDDDDDTPLPITDDFLPCKDEDIVQYLIPTPFIRRKDFEDKGMNNRRIWYLQHPHNHNYNYIQRWTLDYEEPNLCNKILASRTTKKNYHGPLSKEEDKYVLLQLIRHATSDIQRDFRLAAASVLCMASLQCCTDDIDYLRHFIAVISTSDFPAICYGECSTSPSPNHNCYDVYVLYLTSIEILITHGIDQFTSNHAKVLCAWVLMELDQVSDSEIDALYYAADETPGSSSSSSRLLLAMSEEQQQQQLSSLNTLVKRQRAILKQTLQSTKDTLPPKFKSMLVRSVIIGIGKHAVLDRIRMMETHSTASTTNNDNLSTNNSAISTTSNIYYDSWVECIRALVNIGENCLRRLPSQEISEALVSHLIRSFCEAFAPPSIHEPDDVEEVTRGSLPEKINGQPQDMETAAVPTMNYSTNANSNHNHDADDHDHNSTTTTTSTPPEQPILPVLPWKFTLLNPNRYSDTVLLASADETYDLVNRTRKKGIMTPSTVLQALVRALYYRFHVDITISKYGYGDWLSLCQLPLTPYDSLLFNTRCNVCLEASIEDEDNIDVDGEHLVARYEFSLINLIRVWRRPWNPQSHRSFQPMFRNAAKATAMCTHRFGLPNEITNHLLSFFNRDWWPDERKKCWCNVCQFKDIISCLQLNVSAPVIGVEYTSSSPLASSNLRTCKGCNVALYCCKEHKKYILQDGHSRVCGSPPFRIPGKDEERLCEAVSRCYYDVEIKQGLSVEEDNNATFDDDDEESLWESIDSDEDEEESGYTGTTSIIYQFFKKYYDARRVEEPAFARHFAEE